MRQSISVLLAIILVAALDPLAASQISTTAKPNVLVILLDDTGTEKLDFYGQSATYPPTPTLDKLRQAGVLFTNAYVNPLCAPTRTLVQTGRYAFRTGMGTNPGGLFPSLPNTEVTIAEMLKQGFILPTYVCGAFGKYHLTTNDTLHAINNGYDRFEGPLANVGDHFCWNNVTADSSGSTTTLVCGAFDESTFTASVTRAAAMNWINAQTRPFFAYVCFNPPHAPFQVPPLTTVSAATQAQINLLGVTPGQNLGGNPLLRTLAYEWLIEAVDTEVGRLIGGITPAKLKNTTILVLGDNGTPQNVVQPPFDPTHAKNSIYQLGVRVPMIAAGPLVKVPNSTCSALVSGVDLWATIADITGAKLSLVPLPGPSDSLSFAKLISGPTDGGLRKQAFSQIFAPNGGYVPNPNQMPAGLTRHERAMTDGVFKYLRRLDVPTMTYTHEVFNVVTDPFETMDLYPAFQAGMLPPDAMLRISNLISAMITLSGL